MNLFFKKFMMIVILAGIFWGLNIILFKKPVEESEILCVGMMSGWAPFMTIDVQGKAVGFDVDVAQLLATKLGKTLKLVDFGSLAPLFIALEQGKIDCIFSGLDITQERLNKFVMVPYFGVGFSNFKLLFWMAVPEGITAITDLVILKKRVIAVEPGSASEKFLSHFDFIKPKQLASIADMIMDVQYGRSDALILEPLIVNRVIKQVPDLKALDIPIPAEFRIYGMGIALRKDQEMLAQAFQQIINQDKKKIMHYAQQWGLDTGEYND